MEKGKAVGLLSYFRNVHRDHRWLLVCCSVTHTCRCNSVNFPIPQSFSFPKNRQYSRPSQTATTKLHVIRGRLIMRKKPFRPAAIRFCVIDSGSLQRKNTFCNAAKLPLYIITTRSWINNRDGDGGKKEDEVVASLHPPSQRHREGVSDSLKTNLKQILLSSVPNVVSDVSRTICVPFAYCFTSSEEEKS